MVIIASCRAIIFQSVGN